MFVIRILCVISFIYAVKTEYTMPSLSLEALKKGGFRVYIPDISGTTLFAFHANLNDEIRSQNPGTISGETKHPTNGYWVLEFSDKLKVGDTISYWVFVNVNLLGYRKDGESIKITKLLDNYTMLKGRCDAGSTVTNGGQPACVHSVIIEDNFEGSAVSTNIWKVEHKIPTYSDPNGPFNSYENRVENQFIKDNKLHLKPIAVSESEVRGTLDLRGGCTGTEAHECFYEQKSSFLLPPVKSAKIVSKTSFKYGKIEIRAKLPKGDWIFPMVQLESTATNLEDTSKIWIAYSRGNVKLTTYNPSDIDVRKGGGNDIGSQLLLAGPMVEVEEPERSKRLVQKYSNRPFCDAYHTYGLLWKKDEMRFFVDSEEYGTVNLRAFPNTVNREYVLSLGVGVGGVFDFPDGFMSQSDEKPWRNTDRNSIKQFFEAKSSWIKTWDEENSCLIVDYVRVTAI